MIKKRGVIMKNKILKSITYFMIFIMMLGVSMLDSTGTGFVIAYSLLTIGLVWVILFLVANKDRFNK